MTTKATDQQPTYRETVVYDGDVIAVCTSCGARRGPCTAHGVALCIAEHDDVNRRRCVGMPAVAGRSCLHSGSVRASVPPALQSLRPQGFTITGRHCTPILPGTS